MGRGRLGAILASAVVAMASLAGCETGTPSALSPDQAVKVSGRLVGPGGKPVGLTRVVLYRQPSVGEALGSLFVIVASAGVACLADNPPALCRGARRVTTSADGSFVFNLKGSDTHEGSGHNAATFNLAAALPAGGASLTGPETTVAFKMQVADLRLPDIQFWQPALSHTAAAGSSTLAWTPTPATLGEAPVYEAEFEDPEGNLVWAYPAVKTPAALDSRYLEDFRGGVAVHARAHLVGPGTTFEFEYRSHSVAFAGTAGQPLSRRRACFLDDGNGVARRQGPPCTLTDGDLARVFSASRGGCRATAASPCPSAGDAAPYIDLGARVSIDLVVIRGCTTTCAVEVSDDRQNWRPAGGYHLADSHYSANGEAAVALPQAPTQARYVRLNFENHDTTRLTEVSVWGRPGQALPPPTEPVVIAQSTSRGGHPAASAADGGSTLRLLLLVNVVGLLVILAVVVALLRRRGHPRPTPPST